MILVKDRSRKHIPVSNIGWSYTYPQIAYVIENDLSRGIGKRS